MTFTNLILFELLLVVLISTLLTVACRYRLKSFALAVPCWLMFLWFFKGAIDFILAAESNEHLRYFDELFFLRVDVTYFTAISIYLIYFFGYVLSVCCYLGFAKKVISTERVNIGQHYVFLLILCFLSTALYVRFGVTAFQEAIKQGMSAYEYSRFHTGAEKPLMVFTSWLALLSALIGLSAKNKSRWLFIALVIVVFITSGVLGNRHILISGVVFSFIFYFDKQNFSFAKTIKTMSLLLFALSLIMSIYVVREMEEPSFDAVDWSKVANAVVKMTSSSEFIYAHMSMYGILDHDVEPNWGGSVIFLASSVLPRLLLDEREPDIYSYYIKSVEPNIKKGFSISNPAGWYLNFHVPGVAFGGLLLGLICVVLFHLSLSANAGKKLFFSLMFAIFISDVVGFLRSGGPEPLRAVLLIKTLIPALIIYCALQLRLYRAR